MNSKYFLTDEKSYSTPFSKTTMRAYFPKKRMIEKETDKMFRTMLYSGIFDEDPEVHEFVMKALGEGELDPGMIDPRDKPFS